MSVVKIFDEGGGGPFAVWLDTEVADHDGLCIGLGDTRDAAVADAVKDLEARLAELQLPQSAFQTRDQDGRDGGTVEVMDALA